MLRSLLFMIAYLTLLWANSPPKAFFLTKVASQPQPLQVPDVVAKQLRWWPKKKRRWQKRSYDDNDDVSSIVPGVFTCDEEGDDVFANFVNPSYPEADTVDGACNFRLLVASRNVCQIRVDFIDTKLFSPTQGDGNCVLQYLKVSGSVFSPGFRRLCGQNPDQHFYLHIDAEANYRYVDFKVVTLQAQKQWKIGLWISQVDCGEKGPSRSIAAPAGCTQFHFEAEGQVKSFNFEGGRYLADQNYKVCIRANRVACHVAYKPADPNAAFGLKLFVGEDNRRFPRLGDDGRPPSGRGEGDCGLDYVAIPSGRSNTTKIGPSHDRFCGGYMNAEGANRRENGVVFSAVEGPIVWLRFVTSIRNEAAEYYERRRNRVNGNRGRTTMRWAYRGIRLQYVLTDAGCIGYRGFY